MEPYKPEKLPVKNIDWEGLIPIIGEANRELAYYKGALHGVPNPNILLSPLTVQEAVLSSKIEGTQATLGDVYQHEAGQNPDSVMIQNDIKEIMNYRTAVKIAEESLVSNPFTLKLMLELHSVLLDSVRGRDKAKGTFRKVQNWIGRTPNINDAIYIPPEPLFVQELMNNWETYYHADRPDPLVQLAKLHAQFEMIHPFLDGNGRIGRMIIPLFLYEKKLLPSPMFYISEYLEYHREEYYRRLNAISSGGDWNQWIRFFLTALVEQAKSNTQKTIRIMDLYNELKSLVIHITKSASALYILDAFFETPILRRNIIDKIPNTPSRAAVNTIVNKMIEHKIISILQEGSGRKPQILAMSRLLDLCEGK